METSSHTESAPGIPGSKEKILRRIREALQSPAPRRHLGHGHTVSPEAPKVPTDDSDAEQWLPPVPDDLEGRISLFASISESLKTRFIRCRDLAEARSTLATISNDNNWKTVYLHGDPLVESVCKELTGVDLKSTDSGYDKAELADADAGITGCEALVAQTGTILISPPSSGGRVLSVLVPHHIVIAGTDKISRDLRDAMADMKTKYGGNLPRYFSFITGPSRTGDIERILVLGAHGPKELTVILVDEIEAGFASDHG
jgi:L-lactate dehydrogenase complex protein LldG